MLRSTLKHTFEGYEDIIQSFVFLHDNVHIVSGSGDGTMRKWNCDTGLIVGEPWKGDGGIHALAPSPDGKRIACGRENGSIQRWNTNGKMVNSVLTSSGSFRKEVLSLSWSPRGGHIASGFGDGTILIQRANSGNEVVPIVTSHRQVLALAYSPSGDRIASGGDTICIWDTKTGKLVVGPIQFKDKSPVTSLMWMDSSKICCASNIFTRCLESKSGELLHRFHHDNWVNSIALSPKHNVLACVGMNGMIQLLDIESNEPLGRPFHKDHETLRRVSFSPDGRYLAYGGDDQKLTPWMVKDVLPELATSIIQQGDREATQQELQLEFPSSSCLDADAKGGDGIIEEGHDDPYHNFFQSSRSSFPVATSGPLGPPNLPSARRFWNTISRRRLPANEAVPEERPKRRFFARRPCSNSPLELTSINPNQLKSEGKVHTGEDDEKDGHCSANEQLAGKGKGKQQDEPPAYAYTQLPNDPTPPAELDRGENRNLWKRLMRAQGKDPADTKIAPAMTRPEVIEVYAVRGFQRYVAMKRVRKKKLPPTMCSAPLAAAYASGSSQPGPSLHPVAVNVGQCSQASGVSASHTSPSHFVTNYHTSHDSESSRSSIEGSCNKLLDKICFPRGHYHKDS